MAVAIDGDLLVVGAPYEDNAATGVVPPATDLTAPLAGAVYVYRRTDANWNFEAYIKALDTRSGDLFGRAVAISGTTIAVGAPSEDSDATGINRSSLNEDARNSGAVYVFSRRESWYQHSYVKASNTQEDDHFGSAVALDANTLVVGAPDEDGDDSGRTDNAGAIYVYTLVNTTWSEPMRIVASVTDGGDAFGTSVAVCNDVLVVGVPGDDVGADDTDVNAMDSGAAWVFQRDGSNWAQQAYLKAMNTSPGDSFGASVAIDDIAGDIVVVVGALGEAGSATSVNGPADDSLFAAGAAYVYVYAADAWLATAHLKVENAGEGDKAASAVAISGTRIAIGAPFENSLTTGINSDPNEGAPDSGAVYVFE